MPIGRKMGSIRDLKESLKTGGSGKGTFIKYIPRGTSGSTGSLTVRFLEDPESWVNYYEHWDETLQKAYPCIDLDCPGCATNEKRSSRYLANALDVESDRVIPLQLPKTLTSTLVALYERYGTLTDRDIELLRSGEKLDTTYNAVPEAPMPRKVTKYQMHDLQQVLDDSFASAFGVDDDDDEEPPKAKNGRGRSQAARRATHDVDDDDDVDDEPEPPKPKAKGKKAPKFEPDVEDVEDDEEPEADDEPEDAEGDDDFWTEDELEAMGIGALRAIARDDYGINTKGMTKPELIEAILEPEDEDDEDE